MTGAGRRLLRMAIVLATLAAITLAAFAWLLRGPVVRAPRIATQPGSIANLRATVHALSVDAHPRSYRDTRGLALAAAHVEDRFRSDGLVPARQDYVLREGTFTNVLATQRGSGDGTVVIVAHYDAAGSTPGADDNASGVAVLLELARLAASDTPLKTRVFAATCTEEPPFYGTADMGSAHLLRELQASGARIDLMVSIEMVGRFSDELGSQDYPSSQMGVLYPSRGNFLAVASWSDASEAIGVVKRGLRGADVLPVVSLRAPRSFGWVDLSDHLPFLEAGLPAVMVTDGGPLRNRDYHGAGDTADRLDFERMTMVVQAMQGVLAEAERISP